MTEKKDTQKKRKPGRPPKNQSKDKQQNQQNRQAEEKNISNISKENVDNKNDNKNEENEKQTNQMDQTNQVSLKKQTNKTGQLKESKKLDPEDIEQLDKELEQEKQIILDAGEKEYEIKIDQHFRESKINDFIQELNKNLNLSKKYGGNLEEDAFTFYNLLLVKYFTDFGKNHMQNMDLYKQLQVLDILIDYNFLVDIINSFKKEEIDKLIKRIEDVSENVMAITDEMANQLKSMEFDNEDVLKTKDWVKQVQSQNKNTANRLNRKLEGDTDARSKGE